MQTTAPDFFSREFLDTHITDTLSFYHPHCIDDQGGFFHYFSDDGRIYNSTDRHLVSSCRFIFNYAQAYTQTRQPDYLAAVEHGVKFLRNSHLNADTGGYAWQLNASGVVDGTNHCYGLAFVLLAYSSAVKAGLSQYTDYIEQSYQLMERYFWNPEAGLYADEASADWQHLSDYRGQNANMHSCEALIAAYEATADSRFLDRAFTLADNICNRQAALTQGNIWEHYNSDWQPDWQYNIDDPKNLFRPWGYQPGHFTEWAKLLLILDRYRPSEWLYPRAKELFDSALSLSWDSKNGGIFYGFAPDSSICDDDKYFWVQAESFAAAALLYERATTAAEKEKYLHYYQSIWQYSWQHMVDHQYGAWYRILDAENNRYDECKSPAGKTDYHTMGACYEVLAVLRRQAEKL